MLQVFVTYRNTETIPEGFQAIDIQFLNLVRLILTFGFATHAIPFYGMSQNNRGLPFVIHGFMIRSEHLVRVMPATVKFEDILIAEIFNQIFQLRILFEEMLTCVLTAFRLVVLVLTINGFIHALLQKTLAIFCQ